MPDLRKTKDALLVGAGWLTAGSVSAVALWIVGDVVYRGAGRISWSFLTHAARDAGRAGGLGPMIVSTLCVLGVCLIVTIPVGLGAAALLAEGLQRERRLGRIVGRSLDVAAGVPSIVFALFGNALFCVALGFGYSILSGGLTLACMVLPLFIRTAESGLRAVPDDLRQAAAALGFGRARALVQVILPAAVPAIIAALVLSVGRALAETAALLFTAGAVDRLPGSVLDSGRTLSVHIYTMAMDVAGGEPNAYGAAVVLIGLLLIINAAVQLATRGAVRGGVTA